MDTEISLHLAYFFPRAKDACLETLKTARGMHRVVEAVVHKGNIFLYSQIRPGMRVPELADAARQVSTHADKVLKTLQSAGYSVRVPGDVKVMHLKPQGLVLGSQVVSGAALDEDGAALLGQDGWNMFDGRMTRIRS